MTALDQYRALVADAHSPGTVAVLADWHEARGEAALAAFVRDQSTRLRARLASQIVGHMQVDISRPAFAEGVAVMFRCGVSTARLVLDHLCAARLLAKTSHSNWCPAFYRLRKQGDAS